MVKVISHDSTLWSFETWICGFYLSLPCGIWFWKYFQRHKFRAIIMFWVQPTNSLSKISVVWWFYISIVSFTLESLPTRVLARKNSGTWSTQVRLLSNHFWRLKRKDWRSQKVIELIELMYLSNKEALYIFCRNETSRAIHHNEDWSVGSQSLEPTESCKLASMNIATLKTVEDANFAFEWMAKKNIPIMQIHGTIVR